MGGHLLNEDYTSLPSELKRAWRSMMFRKMQNKWMEQQLDTDGEPETLDEYIEGFLRFCEADEDYEMCAGIQDIQNERRQRLDK